MFSNYKILKRKTGKDDYNRNDFLQAILNEYQEKDTSEELKTQILANLVNFSYDPINYARLRELKIISLFVDCIDIDENLNGIKVHMGISGICNLTACPVNQSIVMNDDRAVSLIIRCLSSDKKETIMAAMTTLYQLINKQSKGRLLTIEVKSTLKTYANSENTDVRLKNLSLALIKAHDISF